MNYKKELAKLNVSETDMLKNGRMREMVEAINDLAETEGVIKAKLKSGEGDEDELKADLAEVQNDIREMDKKLVEAIPHWNNKRISFLEKMKNGAKVGRKPKQASGAEPAPAAPATPPAPTPAPAEPETPKAEEKPAVPAAASGGQVAESKKGNGGAFIFFGVLALVVTVGAVNLFNKK